MRNALLLLLLLFCGELFAQTELSSVDSLFTHADFRTLYYWSRTNHLDEAMEQHLLLIQDADFQEKIQMRIPFVHAVWHARLNNWDRANDYFEESLIQIPKNDEAQKALSLLYFAYENYKQKRFTEGLLYYNQADELYLKLGDYSSLSKVYYFKGLNFLEVIDFENALESFEKSLSFGKRGFDSTYKITSMMNIAGIYIDQMGDENYYKADSIYQILLQRSDLRIRDQGIIYSNLGASAVRQGQVPEAINYLNEALSFFVDSVSYWRAKINLGAAYNASENFTQAAVHLKEVEDAVMASDEIELKKNLNYGLLRTALEARDYDAAQVYLKRYNKTSRNHFDLKSHNSLNEIEVKYKTKHKDNELRLQSERADWAEQKADQNQKIAVYACFALLGLFASLIISLRMTDRVRRMKDELKDKNEALNDAVFSLEKFQDNLKQKNEELSESLEARNRLFAVLSHDLRSPIGQIRNLLSFYLEDENRNGMTIDDYIEGISMSKDGLARSYSILENLLNWSNLERGKLSLCFESVSANQFLESIREELLELNKSISLRLDLVLPKKDVMVYADENALSIVLRNLANNAIKFSLDKDPELRFELQVRNQMATFLIHDEGCGMADDVSSSLFEPKNQFISTDSSFEGKGSGLGLVLCREFVNKHGGEIWVESVLGEGADFYFTIPLAKVSSDKSYA